MAPSILKLVVLLPHSPDHKLTQYIHAKYVSNYTLEASLFSQYLERVTLGQEAKALHLQEILGYNISGVTGLKKATVCIGERDSGKTTLNAVIQGLLGLENVSHFSLSSLEKRFVTGKLMTQRVNIFGELSSVPIRDGETFRALTGSEWCEAENKCQSFCSRPATTKLIFAGNHLPSFSDPNDFLAFLDRITLFEFAHSIPKGDRIRNFDKTLLQERDLIASWPMEGLMRLWNNGFQFHEAEDAQAIRRSKSIQMNQIEAFLVPRMVTIAEAAQLSKSLEVGISKNYIRSLCQEGKIPCCRVGAKKTKTLLNWDGLLTYLNHPPQEEYKISSTGIRPVPEHIQLERKIYGNG